MNLASICRRHVVTIDQGATLQQAALLMREQHVGALVITEEAPDGLRVTGLVTDRDLAIEVLARGIDGAHVPVSRLGGGRLVSAPEETDLLTAVDLMQTEGVRRLLVRDGDGRLIGLASFDDLLQACVAPLAGLSEVLRKGLEREAAERGAIAVPPGPPVRVPAVGTAGWTMS